MLKQCLIFILAATFVSGCSQWEKWTRKKPKPSATSVVQDNFLGTVSTVNEEGKFVLIDFGGFAAPEPNAELQVRRGGEEVATLKAGAEVRRPFAAADILQGTPQPGDDVWSKKPKP